MIVDRHLFYRGQVQGVGFRYTVKQLAAGYEVTGWVRNLEDGRVELVLRGDQEQVESLLAAIASSHLGERVRERQEGPSLSAGTTVRGFEIRR